MPESIQYWYGTSLVLQYFLSFQSKATIANFSEFFGSWLLFRLGLIAIRAVDRHRHLAMAKVDDDNNDAASVPWKWDTVLECLVYILVVLRRIVQYALRTKKTQVKNTENGDDYNAATTTTRTRTSCIDYLLL